MLEEMVKDLCKEKVEQIAWDIIPDLAENLIRNEIKEIIDSPYLLYYDKIRETIKRLHILVNDFVSFYDYKTSEILKIEKINTCINSDCESSWCLRESDNQCKVLLPKKNLLTKSG